jgi:hypothetical protein
MKRFRHRFVMAVVVFFGQKGTGKSVGNQNAMIATIPMVMVQTKKIE